jgi:hypothetical protein
VSLPGERERAGRGGRRTGAQGAQPQPGQNNNFIVPDLESGAFLTSGPGIRIRNPGWGRNPDPG